MTLACRRLPLCAALLLAACSDDGSMTSAGPATTGGATSTSDAPTGAPTSTTLVPTTGTTGGDSSSGGATDGSTTGVQSGGCSQITDENACELSPDCKWGSAVGYTHGTKGCQASLKGFCVPKATDPAITSYWKDDGEVQVLQFGFDPTDLGPDWTRCDCDGPLACLCSSAALDCPERLAEFCGEITAENGCINAAAAGTLVCSWFKVRPTGPADFLCDDQAQYDFCLNATPDPDPCKEDYVQLPYDWCAYTVLPVFWREVEGEIEITQSCDHKPVGWTECLEDDLTQPEDCKCLCL